MALTKVTSNVIATNAISGTLIADNAITAVHIAQNAITQTQIAAGALSDALAANSITAAMIPNDLIDSDHYAAASIDNEHLADDAVDSDELAAGAVDSAHLAADVVTGAKIADDAIDSEHYVDGSIDLAHMSSQSVDEDNLYISNAGSDGQFLSKQSGNSGGLTWAAASTDTSVLENNMAILAFQIATSTAAFNMQDRFIDDYYDTSGIDTSNSSNYIPIIDSETSLLIHSDHSDGSTTITDSSDYNNTITRVGNVVHDTAQAKFGASSLDHGGPNASVTSYLQSAGGSEFDVGSGNFTVDFWVMPLPTALDEAQWFFSGTADHNLSVAYAHQSGTSTGTGRKLEMWASNNGSAWNITGDSASGIGQGSSETLQANVWQHIAMVRNGTNWRLYVDGTLDAECTASGTVTDEMANGLRIGVHGGGGGYLVDGWIDEFRFSKGIARWTSNFTPPTVAYGLGIDGYVGGTEADMTVISTTQTAQSEPDEANLVFLMEDDAGTATINTDIKAYVSKDAGSNWSSAVTLVDQGTWGTNKKILVANDIDISGITGTTSLRYKITTHNQSATKNTQVHGASLAWN